MVDELSLFKTVCLCITSRSATVPQCCECLVIPPLSRKAASDTFSYVCNNSEHSDIVDELLERLGFHTLSITLLRAATASYNTWDHDQLAREWDAHRAQAMRADYDESLAATIELLLTSPIFRKLGPDARELLGAVWS